MSIRVNACEIFYKRQVSGSWGKLNVWWIFFFLHCGGTFCFVLFSFWGVVLSSLLFLHGHLHITLDFCHISYHLMFINWLFKKSLKHGHLAGQTSTKTAQVGQHLARSDSAVTGVTVIINTDIKWGLLPISDLSFRISSLAFPPLNEVTSLLLRELTDTFL